MQIKNEYVKIKNKRTYDFRNTITNEYLKLFNKSQYDDEYKMLSSSEKELIYCYLKTDDELTPSSSYYNIINIHDIIEKDTHYTVDSNDWIKFSNSSRFIQFADIVFDNTGYIEDGNDYKLLFAIKNITTSQMYLTINDDIYIYYNGSNLIANLYGQEKTITKKNNVYYLAFHLHDFQNSNDLLSIDLSAENGLTIDFQYSIIKETSNENYIEQVTNYSYSPYLDLTDLASQYNYRLPVTNESINGESTIEVYYTYDNVSGYSKSDGSAFIDIVNINDLVGQQIEQIAFGSNNEIYAFIDVTASNIIVQENEPLYVYRKDMLSSDALYVGNNYPAHLSPLGLKLNGYTYYGSLYSVGFGFSKGNMHEEYLISENPVKEIDDYTFQIELERGSNETLTPNENLQPNNTLYPVLEVHTTGIYPNNELYPSNEIYPQITDYKYIIYKYNLYRINNNNIIYLNEYYTMSFYTEKKGMVRANTKLERS